MGKRKRNIRRRSTRNPNRRLNLRKFLLVIVTLTILVVGALLVLQPSVVRSLLSVALASSTEASSSPTPTRTILPATLSPQPTPKPTPVRVDAGWKDYSSPANGYALKYPPNMVYREGPPIKDILRSVSFYAEKDSSLPTYQLPEITVSVYANPQSSSTADWIKAHQKPNDASAILLEGVTDMQTVLVDGQSAIGFEEKPAGIASAHRTVVARGAQVLGIFVTDFGDGALRETYSAMVSSLRWSAPRP